MNANPEAPQSTSECDFNLRRESSMVHLTIRWWPSKLSNGSSFNANPEIWTVGCCFGFSRCNGVGKTWDCGIGLGSCSNGTACSDTGGRGRGTLSDTLNAVFVVCDRGWDGPGSGGGDLTDAGCAWGCTSVTPDALVMVFGRGCSRGRALDTPDRGIIVIGCDTCRGLASDTPDAGVIVIGHSTCWGRAADTPAAGVIVIGRGTCWGLASDTADAGVIVIGRGTCRGRGADPPDIAIIFWGCGCCRGCASDPPNAVVVVCGCALWYWFIYLTSWTSSFGVSEIRFLVGIKRTVSCSTAVRATSSCCFRSIAISFQPSLGTWFEPTVTGRDPPKHWNCSSHGLARWERDIRARNGPDSRQLIKLSCRHQELLRERILSIVGLVPSWVAMCHRWLLEKIHR